MSHGDVSELEYDVQKTSIFESLTQCRISVSSWSASCEVVGGFGEGGACAPGRGSACWSSGAACPPAPRAPGTASAAVASAASAAAAGAADARRGAAQTRTHTHTRALVHPGRQALRDVRLLGQARVHKGQPCAMVVAHACRSCACRLHLGCQWPNEVGLLQAASEGLKMGERVCNA